MAHKKKPSLAVELDETGRPARPTPDPGKLPTQLLGKRTLPQVPPTASEKAQELHQ